MTPAGPDDGGGGRMRIAQVMLGRGLGGGERVFVDLCGALAARGHAVLAIGAERSAALDLLAPRPGLERARVRCLGVWDPFCRRAIGRALRRFAPDAVQTHMGRASALGAPAARALGRPVLAMLHNRIELKYYRAVDLLVPTTAAQEAWLREQGVSGERVERIPHFRSLDPAPAARTPRTDAAVVKALGRFVRKKGFDVLLRAAALALAEEARFRLEIGGDGPERDALRALAGEIGIAGSVSFPGWIDDVPAFLDDADLFVLPSRDEPFGLAVLEAMARGVPIVATRIGGPAEILGPATALLVPPDDPAALAAAARAALDAPEEAAGRAAAALRLFEAEYAEPAAIGRYLAAFRRLAARGAAAR